MASGKCEESVQMASRWRQVTSGFSNRARNASGCVRMASGWRQDGVRMRQDGGRQASEVCQDRGVGVRSTSGCVRMRQEGVRVASGRCQDNLASGWRQDDVKRRGARINSRSRVSMVLNHSNCGVAKTNIKKKAQDQLTLTLNLFCTGQSVGYKNNVFESFRIAWVLNV